MTSKRKEDVKMTQQIKNQILEIRKAHPDLFNKAYDEALAYCNPEQKELAKSMLEYFKSIIEQEKHVTSYDQRITELDTTKEEIESYYLRLIEKLKGSHPELAEDIEAFSLVDLKESEDWNQIKEEFLIWKHAEHELFVQNKKQPSFELPENKKDDH